MSCPLKAAGNRIRVPNRQPKANGHFRLRATRQRAAEDTPVVQLTQNEGVATCAGMSAGKGQGGVSATASSTITRHTGPFFSAGPGTPAPDLSAIDRQPINMIIMSLFRRKMVQALGEDVDAQGYDAIIQLTRKLNSKFGSNRITQERTIGILNSLFPSWLPRLFKIFFAQPLPELSCKMNALATALSCQWLMGPCKVNDVETDGGKIGKGQGVLVERCRYLEESGCASICINSCKVPTQEFFEKSMGLKLTMTPNYEDFSCQFAFGKSPTSQMDDDAFQTPCFSQCPTKHSGRAGSCPNVQPCGSSAQGSKGVVV